MTWHVLWLLALASVLSSSAQRAMVASDEQVKHVYFSPDGQRVLVAFDGENGGRALDDQRLKVLTMGGGEDWNVSSQHDLEGATGKARSPAPNMLLDRFWPLLAPSGFSRQRESRPVFAAKSSQVSRAGQSVKYPVKLWVKTATLKLNVSKGSGAYCPDPSIMDGFGAPAEFSLVLTGADGRQQVLAGPKSSAAPCVYAYELRRVDVQGKSLLITVAAHAPGVEGPNISLDFVIVTVK